MNKLLLAIVALSTSYNLCAQTAFPSVGGEVTGNNGSLSYTVGQLAVSSNMLRSTNAEIVRTSLHEGVHQTYRVEELSIDNVLPLDFMVNIYPNPTTDMITVAIEEVIDNLRFEFYAVDGQLLQRGDIRGIEQTINVVGYPSGSYMLRVVAGKTENNYRIIKIQ